MTVERLLRPTRSRRSASGRCLTNLSTSTTPLQAMTTTTALSCIRSSANRFAPTLPSTSPKRIRRALRAISSRARFCRDVCDELYQSIRFVERNIYKTEKRKQKKELILFFLSLFIFNFILFFYTIALLLLLLYILFGSFLSHDVTLLQFW